jgi:hypothetical protein
MKLTSSSIAPRDVDLRSTRRRFLLAREQLAAQSTAERYFAVRDMRRSAAKRPAADAPVTAAR